MGGSIINKIDEIIWLVDDCWAGGSSIINPTNSYFIKNAIRVRKCNDKKLISSYIELLRCYTKNNYEILEKILGNQSY